MSYKNERSIESPYGNSKHEKETLNIKYSQKNALIIVPCLNEEAHILGLIEFLVLEAPGALIVIVDGGSSDNSRSIIYKAQSLFSNVVLLDNPDRTQSTALNLAVNTYGEKLDWIIRIDAHCLYPQGYILGLLEAAQKNNATSVVVPMITRGEGCFQKGVATAQNSVFGTGGSPHRHVTLGQFVDHGHHALFRMDLYRAVGGYDVTFSHNEDAELDYRLVLAGARIWLEPRQAITYLPRRTPIGLARQYFGYGNGRARTVAKHGMKLKMRQLLPLVVPPAIAIIPGMYWVPAFGMPVMIWMTFGIIFGFSMAWRQKDPCVILSGLAALIMHASWAMGYWWQWVSSKSLKYQK